MATLGTLKTGTVDKIGSIDATTDETKLERWANEAVLDFLLRTHCYVTTGTASLSADVSDYTLDTDILLMKHAYLSVGSDNHRVQQVSPAELMEMRITGGSVSVSDSPTYYAIEGANLLRVYPTPSGSVTLNFTYVPRPTAMSDDSHDPSNATYGGIPAEFHKALEFWMCAQAGDYDDDQGSGHGARYLADYMEYVRLCRRSLAVKGNVSPPRFRVGRLPLRPHSPSQDVR